MNQKIAESFKPTGVYVGATWGMLGTGVLAYSIGIWRAALELNEKGFYLAVFLLAMFSVVTLQKVVRDKLENIPVTNIFYGMSWAAFIASLLLLVIGLFNATLSLSEKGFYGISFVLSLFSVVTVQKNIRDIAVVDRLQIREAGAEA